MVRSPARPPGASARYNPGKPQVMPTPVIYLHGFASGPGSSKAQVFRRRLEERGVEVEIPDLAADGFENLTLSGQLRVVETAARGRPVSLVGSSMGGYLAALYAARHPEVDRLVLLAPAFGFARRWAESLGEEKVAAWRRSGFLEVFHYAYSEPRQVGWNLMQDGERYEEFPDVRQPVLVYHGTGDAVVPAALSERFADGRPNVTLRLVASDHQLLNVIDGICEEAARFLGAP